MCRRANNILGHIYLLFWECICALPAVVLFNNRDGKLSGADGIAFFIIVVAVALYGTIMIIGRTCCDCACGVKWCFNVLLIIYILAQLGVCGWSGFFAYKFINPFVTGFDEYYIEYVEEWNVTNPNVLPPKLGALKNYYIVGAVASILISIMALIVIANAVHVMKDGPKKKKKQEKLEEEQEPLLQHSISEDANVIIAEPIAAEAAIAAEEPVKVILEDSEPITTTSIEQIEEDTDNSIIKS